MTKDTPRDYSFLDGWEGKIVVCRFKDKWRENREQFLYNGIITDQHLREILPNEVIIEFDHLKDLDTNSQEFKEARAEAVGWIEKIKKYLLREDVNFYITDHNGKCPHLRLQIKGLEYQPFVFRREYKEKLVDHILKDICFSSEKLVLDRSLLISEKKLISLEYQPHFKEKWGGATEEIIFKNSDGQQLEVIPEEMKKIIDEYSANQKIELKELDLTTLDLKDVNVEGLISFWKEYYKEGQRNSLIVALGGICRKKGIPQKEGEELLKKLLESVGSNEFNFRIKEFIPSYEREPKEVAVLHHLKRIGEEKGKKIYEQMKKCFQKNVTLEVKNFYNISQFGKSTKLFLGQRALIYCFTKESELNKTVYSEKELFVYESFFGIGENPIFIFSKKKIDSGDVKLYLEPMVEEELSNWLWKMKNNFLYYTLCKKLNIRTTKGEGRDRIRKGKEELIAEIIEYDNYSGIFFIPTLPLPLDELKKHDNFLELCSSLLKEKIKVSDKLVYLTISHIPEVNPYLITPRNFMKYADHEIDITAGGEGKSTLTFQITGEPNTTEATIPNLLGSSDGKIKWDGKLQNRTKLLCLDENQERIEGETLSHLNNFLEEGTCTRGKGLGINVEGYCPVRFLGNAKPSEKEKEEEISGQTNLDDFQKFMLIKRWKDLQLKLSDNVFPFNRRIATLLFDDSMEKAEGEGKTPEEEEQSLAIIRTIAEGFNTEFTQLFFNKKITEWLNAPFNEDYCATITNLAQECRDNVVKETIKARAFSFRHTKGQSLKLSWLEVDIFFTLLFYFF